MKNKVIYRDLGGIEYKESWDLQHKLHGEMLQLKSFNHDLPACEQQTSYNYLLFCEHPHVYTLGKSGSDQNLLVNETILKQKGATFFKIDRGGDITYHGPGQIVGYPIFDLEAFRLGVKQYIYNLEEAVILTLREYYIDAERLEGATGVWLDTGISGNTAKPRKICAIGVKVSRAVTMHGFAFNVNTDLQYYDLINPCGFTDKGVTSMEKELVEKQDFNEVKAKLKNNLSRVFGLSFHRLKDSVS